MHPHLSHPTRPRRGRSPIARSLAFALALAAPAALGQVDAVGPDLQEAAASGTLATPSLTLAPLTVIGSEENLFSLPGSGVFLEAEAWRAQNYTSVNRALARVPGVYTREEDGFGNFPNISIRGGDGTRNEKVTVMEDGILSAPAAYSAPGAYYSPRLARMAGIEILKGSSQVRYGPHTTGGVINYLSTPIPEEWALYSRNTYGSFNTFLSHSHFGDTVETGAGKFGYLVELLYHRSDGFRTIDASPGRGASKETGFEAIEPMIKLSFEPDSAVPQRFEFKYGYTDLVADETYIGLAERDLARSPYSRYAGTLYDSITTEHHRTYLSYQIEPTESFRAQVAAYYNEFSRDWYKVKDVNGSAVDTLLANPSASPADFDTLRLRGPGRIGIRSNYRSYKSYGAQASTEVDFTTAALEHTLAFGIRWHEDEAARFQRDDALNVGPGGRLGSLSRGAQGSGGNRIEEATALALWAEDSISVGRLTLRPGVRYEHIDMSYTNYLSDNSFTRTASDSGSLDLVAPGIGFTFELVENTKLFGGVYKGFSPPAPSSYLASGVDAEEAISYELGLRHRQQGFGAELVGFYTDFSNLVGSASGLGASSTQNAGSATVYGIEASVNFDPLASAGGDGLALPTYLSATWTNATLDDALSTGGKEDIFAGGRAGADMPYVPEWKLAAGVGLDAGRWGVNLDATYASSTTGTANNALVPRASSREGLIDAVFLTDISVFFKPMENLKIMAGVQNLFDELYVVSRIPDGPRAGAPRQWYVGLELTF